MKSGDPSFVSVGCNEPRGRWHIQSHRHDDHEMVVLVRGRETVVTGGRRFEAEAGDVFWFAPGVAHEEWGGVRESLQTYFVHFDWPGRGMAGPVCLRDAEGRVRLLASWIHAGRDSALPETRSAREAFFAAMLRECERLLSQKEEPLVASVRAHVRQNLGQALTLDLLARHAGMSKYHFIRRYRRMTGRSPMADVRAMRVAQARDLILTTGLPLKAIAPMCGLGEERALYRLFRAHFRMTPGQVRRG